MKLASQPFMGCNKKRCPKTQTTDASLKECQSATMLLIVWVVVVKRRNPYLANFQKELRRDPQFLNFRAVKLCCLYQFSIQIRNVDGKRWCYRVSRQVWDMIFFKQYSNAPLVIKVRWILVSSQETKIHLTLVYPTFISSVSYPKLDWTHCRLCLYGLRRRTSFSR